MSVVVDQSIAQALVAQASEMKMKEHIHTQLRCYAAQIAVHIQTASAEMDPEVLQLPGGSVIATLLWLYSKGAGALRRHF
jgi:hypothetical protein